jgi:hypothetical protein
MGKLVKVEKLKISADDHERKLMEDEVSAKLLKERDEQEEKQKKQWKEEK